MESSTATNSSFPAKLLLVTLVHCSCLICSGIAENDEVVEVENFIEVGNILEKIWVALLEIKQKLMNITCHMQNDPYLLCYKFEI